MTKHIKVKHTTKLIDTYTDQNISKALKHWRRKKDREKETDKGKLYWELIDKGYSHLEAWELSR